jgi:FlaA1/EpsC-like NDP-sugar epimerase
MLTAIPDPESFAERFGPELLNRPVRRFPLSLENWQGRRVLITGAGTVGRAIASVLLDCPGVAVLLLDHAEQPLFRANLDLVTGSSDGSRLSCELGSIRDRPVLHRLFEGFRPDTVIHTAAIKHVALAETHPAAAVRTNVLGTEAVLSAGLSAGMEHFVHVSTDKAVEPVSIMGATKRLAERLVCASDHPAGAARCTVVRSGNVLGSSGSVLAAFLQRAARGAPLPVKQPNAARYFLTPRETAEFVLASGPLGESAGIAVPLGLEPLRVGDLTARLLHILDLPQDYPQEVRALDPGERLAERLWSGPEPTPSGVDGIGTIPAGDGAWDTLERGLSELGFAAIELNVNRVIEILAQLVVDYAPLKNRPGE